MLLFHWVIYINISTFTLVSPSLAIISQNVTNERFLVCARIEKIASGLPSDPLSQWGNVKLSYIPTLQQLAWYSWATQIKTFNFRDFSHQYFLIRDRTFIEFDSFPTRTFIRTHTFIKLLRVVGFPSHSNQKSLLLKSNSYNLHTAYDYQFVFIGLVHYSEK